MNEYRLKEIHIREGLITLVLCCSFSGALYLFWWGAACSLLHVGFGELYWNSFLT